MIDSSTYNPFQRLVSSDQPTHNWCEQCDGLCHCLCMSGTRCPDQRQYRLLMQLLIAV